MRDETARRRGIGIGLALTFLLCACTSAKDGSGIARVTGDTVPTSAPQPTANSYPPPDLPTSPSCALLTTQEISTALDGSDVQKGFGTGSKDSAGASRKTVSEDRCSWQQLAGTTPGRSVQIVVTTARSDAEAVDEYKAQVDMTWLNTAPTLKPAEITGVGARAVVLPEWLIALQGSTVLSISVSSDRAGEAVAPQILERLAKAAAQRLGW